MIHIVLVEPEIPSNTGNIIRTCVATGSVLHLVRPLGFDTSDKMLKRAGLDYFYDAEIHFHDSFDQLKAQYPNEQFFYFSTKAKRVYSEENFPKTCFLVFGRETKGLPEQLLVQNYQNTLRIPMLNDTRSLNLANSVAIVLYEVHRQHNFTTLNKHGTLKTTE